MGRSGSYWVGEGCGVSVSVGVGRSGVVVVRSGSEWVVVCRSVL